MAYKDPEKQKLASKAHYENNKKAYLLRNKKYRKEIIEFIQTLKESVPCVDCNQNYPYYVMDFDHLDDKKYEINFLASSGRIALLKQEILKCDVVCSNCHRIRTHERKQLTSTRSSAD